MPSLLLIVAVATLLTACTVPVLADDRAVRETVHFRDVHRHGNAAIIGHFDRPIGQIVTLAGVRAKPSKISNQATLSFTAVNGVAMGEQDAARPWPPLIQIRNVDALPPGERIVLEGYEFVVWRGSADKNWRLDIEFMATRVIAPASLVVNDAMP